jgi:hypothetical protein
VPTPPIHKTDGESGRYTQLRGPSMGRRDNGRFFSTASCISTASAPAVCTAHVLKSGLAWPALVLNHVGDVGVRLALALAP